MNDDSAPDSHDDKPVAERVADALKEKHVQTRLVQIATWSTRSTKNAEDLVEDALVRAIDPNDSPWERRTRTFLMHMSFLMRQTWDRHTRKLSAQLEVIDETLARNERVASQEPPTDDELHDRRTLERQRMLGERLRVKLVDDPDALEVFDLCSKEDLEPSEQALRLGRDPRDIKAIHQRLRYLGRQILEEWEQDEQRRMKALREETDNRQEQDLP